jgi:hypothetical protein
MDTVGHLISDVCRRIHEDAGFSGDMGERVSWLVLAIAEQAKIELERDAPFLRLLIRLFPQGHAIWQYVRVETTVLCSFCGEDVPVFDAMFVTSIMNWVHRETCGGK